MHLKYLLLQSDWLLVGPFIIGKLHSLLQDIAPLAKCFKVRKSALFFKFWATTVFLTEVQERAGAALFIY